MEKKGKKGLFPRRIYLFRQGIHVKYNFFRGLSTQFITFLPVSHVKYNFFLEKGPKSGEKRRIFQFFHVKYNFLKQKKHILRGKIKEKIYKKWKKT